MILCRAAEVKTNYLRPAYLGHDEAERSSSTKAASFQPIMPKARHRRISALFLSCRAKYRKFPTDHVLAVLAACFISRDAESLHDAR